MKYVCYEAYKDGKPIECPIDWSTADVSEGHENEYRKMCPYGKYKAMGPLFLKAPMCIWNCISEDGE